MSPEYVSFKTAVRIASPPPIARHSVPKGGLPPLSKSGDVTIPGERIARRPASGRRRQRSNSLHPAPATPYVDQLRIGAGRRALAIALAILIPALLLLMLLTFGAIRRPDHPLAAVSVVNVAAPEAAQDTDSAHDQRRDQTPRTASENPLPTALAEPQPAAMPEPPLPSKAATPSEQPPAPVTPPIGIRPPGGQTYGPPDTGRSGPPDSERVGTAPNGEPLYAAAWYREPRDDELRGYLSTASGPGWGLIACRTAPDFRVDDCVGLDEYPNGSQINRAILAAAWAFRVRPPRLGGRPIVGAWVRIRIDYGTDRRR